MSVTDLKTAGDLVVKIKGADRSADAKPSSPIKIKLLTDRFF